MYQVLINHGTVKQSRFISAVPCELALSTLKWQPELSRDSAVWYLLQDKFVMTSDFHSTKLGPRTINISKGYRKKRETATSVLAPPPVWLLDCSGACSTGRREVFLLVRGESMPVYSCPPGTSRDVYAAVCCELLSITSHPQPANSIGM